MAATQFANCRKERYSPRSKPSLRINLSTLQLAVLTTPHNEPARAKPSDPTLCQLCGSQHNHAPHDGLPQLTCILHTLTLSKLNTQHHPTLPACPRTLVPPEHVLQPKLQTHPGPQHMCPTQTLLNSPDGRDSANVSAPVIANAPQ